MYLTRTSTTGVPDIFGDTNSSFIIFHNIFRDKTFLKKVLIYSEKNPRKKMRENDFLYENYMAVPSEEKMFPKLLRKKKRKSPVIK